MVKSLIYLAQGGAAGQFTGAASVCPGDTFTFRCTAVGDMNGITIWRVGGSNECILCYTVQQVFPLLVELTVLLRLELKMGLEQVPLPSPQH